jgi:hypothetical protein
MLQSSAGMESANNRYSSLLYVVMVLSLMSLADITLSNRGDQLAMVVMGQGNEI